MVGKLEKVELRKVWEKEASDFTTWLAEHLDVLSEYIDYPLSLLEREKPAGAFSADLFAEGNNGETVVIENQLEKTDHDHLGKLITYLSNLDAKTAIWITPLPRPEHVEAVTWLNEITPPDTAFYLVRIEAFRIGTSEPAPLFTTVAGPSEEAKERGEKKQELAERYVNRLRFWEKLLTRAKDRTSLHANVSPSKDNWLNAGAGTSGVAYGYTIRMEKGCVELFIDRGPQKKEETDAFFAKLQANSSEIEQAFGQALEWDRVEGRRICRIKSHSVLGGLRDEEQWPEIQDDMIERMIRLENALRPHVKKLK